MPEIIVRKLNHLGELTWEYRGMELERGPSHVLLEATFDRADTPFYNVVLRRGDRFVETFYTDRWYNIFAVHDKDDGHLKVWYCNVGMPAVLQEDTVSYVDLALDMLVYPDGRKLVLDEDEFEELPIPAEQRAEALRGLEELKALHFSI